MIINYRVRSSEILKSCFYLWQLPIKEFIKESLKTLENIKGFWSDGNLEIRQKIQKILFTDGIQWDKKNRAVRTPSVNRYIACIVEMAKDAECTKKERSENLLTPSGSVAGAGLEPTTFGL